MKVHERIALDWSLPPPYRGRDGAEALVRAVPLRASVMGVTGTFDLTRLAHEALVARRRCVFAHGGTAGGADEGQASAGLGRRVQEGRLLWRIKRAWPVDSLILENRAFGLPGLAFNSQVCQAQAVLLTQVSRNPEDGHLGPSPERAVELARSLPPKATLVSGEREPATRDALREAVRQADAFYVDAAPRDPHPIPGLEAVTVLDRFLRIRLGEGLTSAERVRLLSRLERRLQWSPSAFEEVRWHEAAGLEPAALRATLDHLLRRWPARVHLVAYFSAERAAEAARLVPALRQAFDDGVVAHAYIAGPGSRPIMRDLGSSMPLTLYGRATTSVPGLLRVLRREGRGGALVTVGDRGSPWMRAVTSALRRPGLRRGAWAPYKAQAAALPAAISPAGPPIPAPAMGRRSKANILGDPDPVHVARNPPPAQQVVWLSSKGRLVIRPVPPG